MINCDNLLTCLINIFGTRTKKRRQISNEKKKKESNKNFVKYKLPESNERKFFLFLFVCLFCRTANGI